MYASSPGRLHNGGGLLLKVITAVNERLACGMTNEDLGVSLVGPQVLLIASLESNVTEIASAYQTQLAASREAACMDMGLCKFISEDWIQFLKRHAHRHPNGREDSLEVSNLGYMSFGEMAGWSVEGLWFAQGRNVTGPAVTLTMVSSKGGLKAVLSAVPQAIPCHCLVAIGESFQEELAALLSE